MSLSALSTAMLLPPVNLVPLALAGMVIARRYPRIGEAVSAVALAVLLLLGMPVIGNTLLDSLQAGLPRTLPEAVRQRPDLADQGPTGLLPGAIVILSADGSFAGPGGILPEPGLGLLTLERIHAGAILARRVELPVLVTGGVVNPGRPPIAITMARTLQQDFGLTAAWIEPRSNDTWENAAYSAQILKTAGIRSVYLVTNGWHLRRSLMAFRHFGIEAIPVASRFSAGPRFGSDDFVPRVTGWINSYYAIHEWIGCAGYAVRS